MHIAEGAEPRFAARQVFVMGAEIDASGLRVLRLAVGDEADESPPLAHGEHPSVASSEAFAAWASRLGTGGALPNVYVPGATRLSTMLAPDGLFTGPELDPVSRRYFTVAPDARALRVRARIVQWLALRSVVDAPGAVRWASLGCGPAFPLIGALAQANAAGADPEAMFIDTCAEAVDASRRIALAHGIDPGSHGFLTVDDALALDVPPLAEGSVDLIEALTLLEGRAWDEAVAGLARAFALVRPGGSLVFSAMLEGRPPADAEAGVPWPEGPTHSLARIGELLEAAGISVLDGMAYIAQDGIYAVVEVSRL